MNDATTSLDRLHDLALPPEISWWPPALGWYVVLACLIVAGSVLLIRAVSRYRANAYRRAALRRLASLEDVRAIAELLRRTALAVGARQSIVRKTGAEWPAWLAQQCSVPQSETVREQLTVGVYRQPDGTSDYGELRDYAARWIARHRRPHAQEDSVGC